MKAALLMKAALPLAESPAASYHCINTWSCITSVTHSFVVSRSFQQGLTRLASDFISFPHTDISTVFLPGPATVRMVSNSGPPLPMPMQVPPGHMVQQIVDENGILTHVILSPQPQGMVAPPMTVGYYVCTTHLIFSTLSPVSPQCRTLACADGRPPTPSLSVGHQVTCGVITVSPRLAVGCQC